MSAKECRLAYKTAPHSLYLFTGRPSKVDASFLWADGNIMLIDGSTYFKFDKHSGSLLRGFPLTMMDTDLSGIPPNIDAALSLPEQKTYFFKRGKVWQWGSNGMPKRISDDWSGIPDDLDSAFYWPYNHKAYFFRGEYFYRYDIGEKKVDYGYPKLIASGWPGASPTIDAATSLKNGTVFLIKKNKVFTFHPPVCKEETTFIDGLKKDLFLSWWHHE
ncbi:matrix metalloproteinase-16-like [Rhopilema esculentum]|uniref:matrix metalloproteinase-16-like n=1 Tax=Rhopilema esculentum TaxID=499914 RepID=UPI0031D01EA4